MHPVHHYDCHMFSDDASAVVKSYFTDGGLWSASIKTIADLYFIEVLHFLD